MEILEPTTVYDLCTGRLDGENVSYGKKRLAEIRSIFRDRHAADSGDGDTVVYEVGMHAEVPEGTCGGLFFGTSIIHPGMVGDEYYMTKGHFHARRETAEYYFGISGSGILLLMSEDGKCSAHRMEKGALCYIGGHIAHRLVNTGDDDLVVGACWLSDAGHDYGSIAESGFPVRVVCRDGKPTLIPGADAL